MMHFLKNIRQLFYYDIKSFTLFVTNYTIAECNNMIGNVFLGFQLKAN